MARVISLLTVYYNGEVFRNFNSLMARVISLLTVYYNGEDFRNELIRNKNCGGHVC
jgi:hypothetical protein